VKSSCPAAIYPLIYIFFPENRKQPLFPYKLPPEVKYAILCFFVKNPIVIRVQK